MVKDKGLEVVIKEIKQRVVTPSAKLAKYEAKKEQYLLNSISQKKQPKLFERLGKAQWLKKVEIQLRQQRKKKTSL